MSRSLVIVMFTDIVGSTAMRSRLGDDEADRAVARHDAVVGQLVPTNGGRVIKYLGDGALATFSSAVDAIETAAAILVQLADTGPQIRIGIHAGDVEIVDGDTAGLPVAVAARLCGVAPPGAAVVSSLVRSLVGVRGGFTFESLGWSALKGVTEPVEVWVVGSGTAVRNDQPEQLPSPALGRTVRQFVGREEAIGALDRVYAGLNRQYLVAVSGEPGIGKTTLVDHWAREAYNDGATVVVGSAPPEGVAPYQPFVEAIRPLLKLNPALKPRGAGAASLARLMPELGQISFSQPLLDDPNTERYMINEAFMEVLVGAAESHAPLVLILDDLHWADEASIVLLGHLLRHNREVPVLVIGTYRDTDLDRRHPLADLLRDQRRARRAERLDLAGLEPEQVASLVASVAGGAAPDTALEVIVSETEGNPFFVEEIVEHLVAEAMVVDGAWNFDPQSAMTIPEGIRDTIGRRLDRLSDGAQELLAAAAVIGASFDIDVLVAVVDMSPAAFEEAFEEALAAGFLVEGRGGEISFSHALVRQTIRDEISRYRRSRLHRAAGEALAAAGATSDRLVHHWIEAGDYTKALQASVQAMKEAEAVAAQEAVIKHAATVLELWLDVDPAERPSGFERYQAIVAAGHAIGISRGFQESVAFLRSHRSALEEAGDDLGVGVVLTEEARQLWPLGQVTEGLHAAEQALELIPADPPSSARARAEAQLGRILMLSGLEPERAIAVTRRGLESARAVEDVATETSALATLGVLVPDPVEGEAILRKGAEMAIAQNAVFQITRTHTNLSELLVGQGRYDEAVELVSEALETVKRLGGQGQSLGWMVVTLGQRYYDAGRWSEALETLGTVIPPGYPEALQLVIAARIYAQQGEFDEARRLLERIGNEYDHITDIQFQVPVATARLWLARWAADLDSLPSGIFDLPLLLDGGTVSWIGAGEFILAAAETAAFAEDIGRPTVASGRFDEWMTTAREIPAEPSGEAVRATLRAQQLGFESRDRAEAWAAAARSWPSGSYEHAVAALGWLRSSTGPDQELSKAAETALATAERLAARPLAGELRRYLAG
ncbi:MAG TPA: AAA family ATPase [Acidimicrobiia bacterium]|nr:AAA family ATPase [Acidimicrobiia bacterium]